MKKHFAIDILLTFALTAFIAQSQEYKILDRLTINEELPSKGVNVIYKDSKGFIWTGLNNGLYRFDGYTLKEFSYDLADTARYVAAGIINCIIEDKDGIIWSGGINGLYKYNPRESENITSRYSLSRTAWDESTAIYAIQDDGRGNLWLGTANGNTMPVLNKKTEKFRFVKLDPGMSDSLRNKSFRVNSIILDSDSNLWFGTVRGLFAYNYEKESFHKYPVFPDDPSNSVNQITAICETGPDMIWICTMNGLYAFNKRQEKFTLIFPESGKMDGDKTFPTISVKHDRAGNTWFRTTEGLYISQNGNNELPFRKVSSYRQPSIWSHLGLEFDQSGNIWLGTQNEGIKILAPERNIFRVLQPEPDDRDNIIPRPNCVYEDDNEDIWIGTRRLGLYKYNKKHNHFSHYRHHETDSSSLSGNTIVYIFQDYTGTMWIGTAGTGLNKLIFTPDNQIQFKRYLHDPGNHASLSENHIFKIFEDGENNLWISSNSSFLDKYDRQNDRFIHLDLKTPDAVFDEMQYDKEEYDHEIIFPSWIHIFRIIPPFTQTSDHIIKARKIIKYKPSSPYKPLPGNLTNNFLMSQSEGHKIVWFGTRKGLGKMTVEQSVFTNNCYIQFKYYTEENGLNGNYIVGILEDRKGNVWVTTEKGLSMLDPQTELFTNYLIVRDIIPSDGFKYQWESCKTRQGLMCFPNYSGILIFNPDIILDSTNVPPVFITDFKLFNRSIPLGKNSPLERPVTYSREIKLRYNQNHLTFEYVALDYTDSKRNQYKYKMEGLDKDWILADNVRTANYSSLKPGKYTFRVQGSNSYGVWNTKGASLQILINPPPWKTVWAYFSYGFILIALILWYRRFLLNRAQIRTALEVERVEKEKIQEVDHMKSRFFANISHEFRTPLTLILGPLEDFLRKKVSSFELTRDLAGMMHRNAKRLQRLINQLLDISKLETGKAKLQVSEGNLEESVKAIILSFLSLAERKNIKYTYDLPGTSQIVYFDNDKVEKVLANLIYNAFKFTPVNGEINISFQYHSSAETKSPQFAEIIVSDTGKGIPGEKLERIFDRFYQVSDSDNRDAEGTGIGLALTRELINLYRGEISVESKVGKGTKFKIKLPVSKEQFKEEEIVTVTPTEDVIKETVEPETDQKENTVAELNENHTRLKAKDTPAILIVEDNIDLRNYMSRNLGNGYQILTAENGKQGLELAIETIPDLVISDVMMPEMDGMEMCRHLKTDERTNHIPVIMVTARADRGSKLEGLETGADDYIIKPFDAAELLVRVRNLIEQRRRLREKFSKELISESLDKPYSPKDKFLNKLIRSLDKHVSEPEFTMEQLGKELYMSRAQLYRKVAAVSGLPPNELLQIIRMKHAARLLLTSEFNVTQVMYQVGICSTSHFAQSFRKYFGTNPSDYKHTHKSI